ncbi:LacI family DNA-binding transcriptional regulator [Tessaracoccus sp. G1721]
MKKPTLASLAAELKVSRQTISNVINFPDRVRVETRARVQAAIDRSGYRPSVAARALRNQRAMALGIRLSPPRNGISGAFMDGLLREVVMAADKRGYRVVVFPASDRDEEVERLVELRASLAIDAGIITDTWTGDQRPDQLAEEGVTFVAFGRPWAGPDHEAWVDVDGRWGAGEAARFLLRRGHARIGFIGWSDGSPVGADRRAGWQEALGLTDDEAALLTVEGEDSVDAGGAGMGELLARGATAAVCASDALALGAFIHNTGVTRPDVVGFDDTPVARAIGLPSLRQPVDELARIVLDKVLAQLAGTDETGGELVRPVLETRGH